MCYSYAIGGRKFENMVKSGQDVKGILRNIEPKLRLVNAFEHPKMPIIISDKIEYYNWGLIPSYINSSDEIVKIQNKTLNAVSETIFEKKSFKEAIINKRCIIPANGFFEWRHNNKQTIPYYITLVNESIMWFAGIYNIIEIEDILYKTFSIITTEANELMASIHNTKKRMPLILNNENIENWIKNELAENEIKNILKPFPDYLIKVHTIKKLKISGENDYTEELLEPYNYYEQNELPFQF
jgi:putative SOS response-associated peptidase YedK